MPQLCVRFDEFELDTESFELLRAGQRVKLERIPMQLLVLLLENRGNSSAGKPSLNGFGAETSSSRRNTASILR